MKTAAAAFERWNLVQRSLYDDDMMMQLNVDEDSSHSIWEMKFSARESIWWCGFLYCILSVGSVDIDYGCKLYSDLVQAQQSLVIANHLHLLYLATPYDMVVDVKPNWMIYLHEASERWSF